ncbi:MAG: Rieske [2Fe-2S] domain [Myxococcaceae bacterium]|nr:Rieske [2Fe-2S] domain [Myxococcaceae bacterium]
MSDEKRAMERRTFLCVVGAAGAAAAMTPGCGDQASTAPFSAGNVSDHPVGVWKMYGAQAVIVGRDANGFFAYSATCTHEANTIEFRTPTACTAPTGCTSISTTGLTRCPVHFSTFDSNGVVITGPASATLPHYQVTVAAGAITVSPATTVAASVRTMG